MLKRISLQSLTVTVPVIISKEISKKINKKYKFGNVAKELFDNSWQRGQFHIALDSFLESHLKYEVATVASQAASATAIPKIGS